MRGPPPISTLFPYTTLFRSRALPPRRAAGRERRPGQRRRHPGVGRAPAARRRPAGDRKSTRLNSSHVRISYAVFCLKKKTTSAPRAADPVGRLLSCSRYSPCSSTAPLRSSCCERSLTALSSSPFCFSCAGHPPSLPSFPTRRSSDLVRSRLAGLPVESDALGNVVVTLGSGEPRRLVAGPL